MAVTIAHIRTMRSTYITLVRKLKEGDNLTGLGVDGRAISRQIRCEGVD
jgi:hypothetical protein